MEIDSILFNRLLAAAAKYQASDLHLSAGSVPVIRQDGRLAALEGERVMEQDVLEHIVRSFLTEAEYAILAERRELTTVKTLGGHFRFKINIYYQKGLLAVSFRQIAAARRGLEGLGLPAAVTSLTGIANGLVVIAGIYGSGKTTTMGALIEQVNQRQKKRILTLEDPIEIIFTNQQSIIEQREIGKDVATLKDGLAYCQYEDVDIIAVSDIRRDFADAMPLILELAAASSLVLLEMHADSAERVVDKILDCFSPAKAPAARALLADVLKAVVVQRLLPKNGGGQTLALEILLGTPAAASVIREGRQKQLGTVMQTGGGEGMVTMATSLARLVASGQVSREEALAAAPDPDDFRVMSN